MNTMKAAIFQEYGSPDVMQLTQLPKPTPKDNEVLIRVHATTVTSGDARVRRADPFLVRFFFGFRHPKKQILGSELAGVVEAVGKDVTEFKVGDRVFAFKGSEIGASVEYICMQEDGLIAPIPEHMSYEEAAAIPFGGTSALYFIKEQGAIEPGQKVLIYGASGSLGTAGIQIAKHYGAEVTGVCSTKNVELVKSLGADHVVDYTREDFTESGKKYDIIFDTVGKSPFAGSVDSLTKEGRYVRAVHMAPGVLLKGAWTSMTTSKKVLGGVAWERREDILLLSDLMDAGKLKAVIDQSFPIEDIAEAHRYVDKGHKRGNVVISWVSDHVDRAPSNAHLQGSKHSNASM